MIAGVMVQYTSWRNVLWLQASMVGLSFILAFLFVPAWQLNRSDLALSTHGGNAIAKFSPLPILKQMLYPDILFTVRLPQLS